MIMSGKILYYDRCLSIIHMTDITSDFYLLYIFTGWVKIAGRIQININFTAVGENCLTLYFNLI